MDDTMERAKFDILIKIADGVQHLAYVQDELADDLEKLKDLQFKASTVDDNTKESLIRLCKEMTKLTDTVTTIKEDVKKCAEICNQVPNLPNSVATEVDNRLSAKATGLIKTHAGKIITGLIGTIAALVSYIISTGDIPWLR